MSHLLLTAERLLVDPWTTVEPAAILIDPDSGRIVALGKEAIARGAPHRQDFPDCVLIPGLIDCHVHVSFSGTGEAGESTIELSEAALLERAHANIARAQAMGVTTLADQGGRMSTVLPARAQSRDTARLLVAGPPITPHGEHMWYFGGESTSAKGVRAKAQAFVDQGVDYLKLVATGGGTAGSNEYSPTFESDELRAAVEVAHDAGLHAAVHASSIEGIARAAHAGCDVIHHCNFYRPDGVRGFDSQVAQLLVERDIAVDPTLWVTESLIARLRDRVADGDELAADHLRQTEERWATKLTDVAGLIRAGVRLIAGSDAGWQYAEFGDTWREIVALAEAGLPPREALASATVHAAQALQIDADAGTLNVGRVADVLVLTGDPTEDLAYLGRPIEVFRRGIRSPAHAQVVDPQPGESAQRWETVAK